MLNKRRNLFAKLRDVIVDKRLYGPVFFIKSGPLLLFGFIIQSYVLWVLNSQLLLAYVPLAIFFVLMNSLAAKNTGKEIPAMNYLLSFMFTLVSGLAYSTQFTFQFDNSIIGLFQLGITMAVIEAALILAIFQITILGQRISLRTSIKLTDDFFKKNKKKWQNELRGLPNLDEILRSLEDGRFIASLFDKGSFNLAVLWSCNTIEKIIDSTVDGIISKMSEDKKSSFRRENGTGTRYPIQLKVLGYSNKIGKQDNEEHIDIEVLWGKIRNDIAHRNYKPTFSETYGTLIILVSFIEEFPKIIQDFTSKL